MKIIQKNRIMQNLYQKYLHSLRKYRMNNFVLAEILHFLELKNKNMIVI
jgi:hypothetical protein